MSESSKSVHRVRADLQEVVRTVNQVYAASVVAVIAAKSQPNLYVYHAMYKCRDEREITPTRMPHTMDISKAVGTMRNRIACSINVMPLLAYQAEHNDGDAQSVLCSAIDGTGESTCLPGKVKFEVQVEQVLKRFAGDLAYGTLTNVGEHGIQQFTKDGRADARGAV